MTLIDRIEIYHVHMPLISPFTTAYGSDDVIGSVLLRMSSGASYGWGESCPLQFPTYSPEWSGGVFLLLREVLGHRLIGREITDGGDVWKQLSAVKQNPFAKAALDLAWWDLQAKLMKQPLWQLLGGIKTTVETGADFGVQDSIDVLIGKIGEAVDQGYKRVKLKYCLGWDLDMVAAVRQTYPKMTFHIDCNSCFSLTDLAMFQKLDQYGLAMIEQPLAHDDLIDHAKLQQQIDTPICLDESINSLHRARQAIEIGACRWINIKPARVGGLTQAKKIHDLCQQAHIPCWIGGMLESALGASFLKALATLPNVRYPSDIFPSGRFYADDLSRPEICLSGPSVMTVSTEPGIGAEPDPDRLEQCTIQKAVLCA